MKIQRLETFTQADVSVVRVTTDDGSQGFGQIAPSNADISVIVFHRQVAPHVLGADPLAIDAVVDSVIEATYKFPGTYVRRALAGLAAALWDLRGRPEDRSVCELWGGTPRRREETAKPGRRGSECEVVWRPVWACLVPAESPCGHGACSPGQA